MTRNSANLSPTSTIRTFRKSTSTQTRANPKWNIAEEVRGANSPTFFFSFYLYVPRYDPSSKYRHSSTFVIIFPGTAKSERENRKERGLPREKCEHSPSTRKIWSFPRRGRKSAIFVARFVFHVEESLSTHFSAQTTLPNIMGHNYRMNCFSIMSRAFDFWRYSGVFGAFDLKQGKIWVNTEFLYEVFCVWWEFSLLYGKIAAYS